MEKVEKVSQIVLMFSIPDTFRGIYRGENTTTNYTKEIETQ